MRFYQKSLSSLFSIDIMTVSSVFHENLDLFSFHLQPLLSLYLSIDISTFSLHLYISIYIFLLSVILLFLYSPIEPTSSSLFHGNLHVLFTFLLKYLLSHHVPISHNLCFLITFLLVFLLLTFIFLFSLPSFEISAFSSLRH